MPLLDEARIDRLADSLLDAYDHAHNVPLPSAAPGGIDTASANAVAERLRRRRGARGERPVA